MVVPGQTSPRADRAAGGLREVDWRFSRLLMAVAFCVALTNRASAEQWRRRHRQWGLIGPWSLPDRNVVHRRDFGDARDEAQVMSLRSRPTG